MGGERHAVGHQREAGIVQAAREVLLAAGEVVVDAQHVVATRQKTLAQVRAQEARATGDQYPLAHESPENPTHIGRPTLGYRTLEITPKPPKDAAAAIVHAGRTTTYAKLDSAASRAANG